MSKLTSPPLVLHFCSVLYNSDMIVERDLLSILQKQFGEGVVFYHPFVPMKKYYSKEMGEVDQLKRFFYMGINPKKREELITNKLWSTDFELTHSLKENRYINIDPGILSLENLILATGKGFSHRVYMEQGIWADLELINVDRKFKSLEWTYYDYRDSEVIDFFNQMRELLLLKI